MIGLVLKDTGPFFCSKIISKHFHSALAEIFFKKILKNHTRLAIFRPHQKSRRDWNLDEPWKQNKQHSSLYPFGWSNDDLGAKTCFYSERSTEIGNRSVVRSDYHEVWIGIMILPSKRMWKLSWNSKENRGRISCSSKRIRWCDIFQKYTAGVQN